MAWNNNNRNNNRNYSKKKGSFSKRMTNLAYQMGQVQKGLENPKSQISRSYNNGLHSVGSEKPTLF